MHTHKTRMHAYNIYIKLSHNCEQAPAEGAYIHAHACATTRTHAHTYTTNYTVVHAQLHTHKHACVICIIVMETQFDLPPCAPGFVPLNAPPPLKLRQPRTDHV